MARKIRAEAFDADPCPIKSGVDSLAQEITDDLQTALEQFTAVTEKVAG